MSVIEANGIGYKEKDLINNWAAEYAKRIVTALRDEVTVKIDELEKTIAARLTEIIVEQRKDKEALEDEKIKHDNDISELKNECESIRTTYASTDQAGLIRLGRDGSGTNKSGLVVDQDDGTCNVYCDPNYGTQRTGGRVATAPATEAEISAQTQEYKPIVPKTLKYAVNTVVGDTIDEINETITEHDSSLRDLLYELHNTQQRTALNELNISDLFRESLRVLPLPEDEGLDVNETGAYIDTAGISNDNGLCRPGVLLVFNVKETDEVYKWYLSYNRGIYVKNGNTWKSV